MPTDPEPPYVAEAGFNRWIVERSHALRRPLRRLGFRRYPFSPTATLTRRRAMTFEEMATLAGALRALGIAFSAGREWCPSEVVQDLRDRGLLEGEFTEIFWTGQGWGTRTI